MPANKNDMKKIITNTSKPKNRTETYTKDRLHWRHILFLPFNLIWRSVLSITGVIFFNLIMYEQIFMKAPYGAASIRVEDQILKAITILYVIDIVLSVLHKTWESVQKSMPYVPKKFSVILVDIISVLPFRYFMTKPFLSSNNVINWPQIVSLTGCLRIYRIFVEILSLQQRMDTNPVFVSIIQQNAIIFCIVSVLGSIWYMLGYLYYNEPESWFNELDFGTTVRHDDPLQMLKYTYSNVYVRLGHDVVANVAPVLDHEMLILAFIKYLGLLVVIFVIASVTHSFRKYQAHIYRIKNHIAINLRCLQGGKFKETKEYYISFWNNWSCIKNCPLIDQFPICLQKDIMTDVYWDAITHSHVLRQFSHNIQRQISLVMESKFLQPGDYLLRKGEVKSNYYYIATGVVQIMSHYDGVSPIMTISGGSCLSDISLILPTPSLTDVICASVCEVRFLTYRHFYDVLKLYPKCFKLLKKIELSHIGCARKMYLISKNYKKDKFPLKLYGVPQEDNLKWIKHRWRTLYNVDLELIRFSEKSIRRLEEGVLHIDTEHTSKYLDLIVLRKEESKFQRDECCIKTKCSYVLDPDCNFLQAWLKFIFIVITIDCIIVPYSAAFMIETTERHVAWDHLVCFPYILDIYFQVITGVRSIEKTIMEPTRLLRHHLKSPRFLLDIVGSIPLREFARFFYPESHISPNLALNRLLKLSRAFMFFKYRHGLIISNSLITIVLKYSYTYLFITYFAVCFTFLNACQFDPVLKDLRCDTKSWFTIYYYDHMNFPSKAINATTRELFAHGLTKSFYAAVRYVYRFLMKTGLKDVAPMDLSDIMLITAFVFISNNLFILAISEITAFWMFRNQRETACNELLKNIKAVFSQKGVHVGLINMIDSFITLQWRVNQFIEGKLESHTSDELISPMLEAQRDSEIMGYLKTNLLFENLQEDNYKLICKAFRIFTVPEGFIFCRSGYQPSSLNIIINGCCKLTSMLKEDVYQHPEGKIIKRGAFFPLMEAVLNKTCLQTTMSVTVCEVAVIDVIELRSILYRDRIIARETIKAGHFKVKDLDIVVSKNKYLKKDETSTPNFVRSRKRIKHNETKQSIRKTNKKAKYVGFVIKYIRNIYKCISYVWSPPFIIHPNGNFMLIWEMVKVIQVVTSILMTSLMHLLRCNKYIFTLYIPTVLDCFALADVFLRMHVGHYNKIGILINKKEYYFKHSFAIDIISALPVNLLFLQYNLKVRMFMILLCKSLQIYRVSGFIIAVQSRFNVKTFKHFFINFLIHLIVIFTALGNFMFSYVCDTFCRNNTVLEVSCQNDSWITSNRLVLQNTDYKNPFYLMTLSFDMILTIFLGNDQKAFEITENEILFMAIFGAISLIVKIYYISRGISLIVGGYQNFTIHRENVGLFWWFVKNEGAAKSDAALLIARNFVFEYSRLRGIRMIELVRSLHPTLQSDLTFAMYYKSMLCLHKFVGKKTSVIKHLTNKVDETFYQKNMVLINIDGINDKIYFIQEGYISVFDHQEKCVKILGPGSMFGSFKRLSKTRHKQKFVSHVHTNILRIKTDQFFVIFSDYGKKYENKFIKKTKNKEFVSYIPKGQETDTLKDEFANDSHTWLNRNLPWFRWTWYVLSMINPYINLFPALLIAILSERVKLLYIIMYTTDAISLLRILFCCFIRHTDSKTGIFISDIWAIRKKYLLAPSGFLLDFFSCLPLEFFYYIVIKSWIPQLCFNRALKLIILIKYINEHHDRIYIRPWLRWFEFIAYITLVPFIYVCTWQYITCKTNCSFFDAKNKTVVSQDPEHMSVMFSLNEIITLFTLSPSYDLIKPSNYRECLVIIVISISSFLLLPSLIGCYFQIADMGNYTKKLFEYNIQCMKLFLQLRDLSDSLLESLWKYSILLWNSDRGELLPDYVTFAPHTTKNELLYDLFGAHLKFNIIFEECRRNFVIQLAGRLKRSIYFPGDFIIRKYDIDNRMYFINSGEVDAIEYGELNDEIVTDMFITGQCFGLQQGLFERVTHMSTYKARSMVEMLTLQREDWYDLLIGFPEESKRLYAVVNQIDLTTFHSYG